MSRMFLAPLVSMAIASLGLVPIGAAAQVSPEVPARFAPCLDGGYKTVVRSNGTSFANLGACVSYAVRGGTLFRSLDASSVYTLLRGFGGPLGPPDANGAALAAQEMVDPLLELVLSRHLRPSVPEHSLF
jgi:hypothetical protein